MQFRVKTCCIMAIWIASFSTSFGQDAKPTDAPTPANGSKTEIESVKKPSVIEESVAAGKSVKRSYDFEDTKEKLDYQIYLPKNYYDLIKTDSKKSFPLIVALHGYGSNPAQIVGYPGLIRRAEKRGYIIVAPMGYNKKGWYGSRGQKGGYGSNPRNLGELSEKDVLNVLKITQDEFKIDPQRIYIYGHSMGGGGSIHLAIKYPEKWAAVAPMAPAMPWGLKDLERAKSIPFFVVHGDNDKVLPIRNTRKFIERLKGLEMKHEYREVKNGDHVSVAWKYLDEIFDFFDEHVKKSSKDQAAK